MLYLRKAQRKCFWTHYLYKLFVSSIKGGGRQGNYFKNYHMMFVSNISSNYHKLGMMGIQVQWFRRGSYNFGILNSFGILTRYKILHIFVMTSACLCEEPRITSRKDLDYFLLAWTAVNLITARPSV